MSWDLRPRQAELLEVAVFTAHGTYTTLDGPYAPLTTLSYPINYRTMYDITFAVDVLNKRIFVDHLGIVRDTPQLAEVVKFVEETFRPLQAWLEDLTYEDPPRAWR